MGCCSNTGGNTGPFAEGRELVEFVYQAHGGGLRNQPIPNGGLMAVCQGCGAGFCGPMHKLWWRSCCFPTTQ
jgi:hypothetical protein